MEDETSTTFSDFEQHLPPNSPQEYVAHDQYLRDRLGNGPINSIKKEIEGMVRFYYNVGNQLDDDTRELLLEQLSREIDKLDSFEDNVAAFISKKDRK